MPVMHDIETARYFASRGTSQYGDMKLLQARHVTGCLSQGSDQRVVHITGSADEDLHSRATTVSSQTTITVAFHRRSRWSDQGWDLRTPHSAGRTASSGSADVEIAHASAPKSSPARCLPRRARPDSPIIFHHCSGGRAGGQAGW
jgi:hypothetical protein